MTRPASNHLPQAPSACGRHGHTRRRGGFTIVEMLVTVAIIIVLLTILITAVSLAGRSAQRASTSFLMGSVNQALVRFKEDHGYFPPVLGTRDLAGSMIAGSMRDAAPVPDASGPVATYVESLQNWHSETSLAEYLLGYGNRGEDGYGFVGNPATIQFPNAPGTKELPLLGFRSPGEDGVWGAWQRPRDGFPPTGLLLGRNLPDGSGLGQAANNDLIPGKVYGPYLDLKDSSIVGNIQVNGDVAFPGDANYDDAGPKAIVDYWGRPLSYYRRLHKPLRPKLVESQLIGTSGLASNLGDIFRLRPWTVPPGAEADGFADDSNDTTTSKALQSADFAILSEGGDRRSNRDSRVDTAASNNNDNIVESGR